MKEEQQRDAQSTRPSCRILVVDDNRDAGETLAQLLAANGFTTRYVDDGNAALAELRTFAPQLAILDIGLPTIDGYELARQMKSLPEGSGLPLIAVSGYADEGDDRTSAFSRHMVKPVRIEELLEAIDTLIDPSKS